MCARDLARFGYMIEGATSAKEQKKNMAITNHHRVGKAQKGSF